MSEQEIERLARLYCKHLGVDPDADANPISVAAGFPSGIPKWWVARDDVRRSYAMRAAIAEFEASVPDPTTLPRDLLGDE